SNSTVGPADAGAKGARRRPIQSIYHPWSSRNVNPASAAAFTKLGPVTPSGVVGQEGQELRCLDPLSGELIWKRTDLPAGCELFGDDQCVLAASLDEGSIYTISMADGEIVDHRKLPAGPWLLTSGRNVAQFVDATNGKLPGKSLRIVDAAS